MTGLVLMVCLVLVGLTVARRYRKVAQRPEVPAATVMPTGRRRTADPLFLRDRQGSM